MVTSENKDRETQLTLCHEHYPKNSNVIVHRPQPTLWYGLESLPICSSIPDGNQREIRYTHPSAFHSVSTVGYTNDRRRHHKTGLNYKNEAEENTQVTWCSTGANYICSVAVTGGERVRDVYPPNSLRKCLDDISRCDGQDNENQGETDALHYKTDVCSHSASSPECGVRSDEGSTSLSPVDSSTRHITSERVLNTVISAPIKTTSHQMWDVPSTEIVAKYTNLFAKNSEQCRSGPVCISNIGLPRSHSPPNRVTAGYNKSLSLLENETLSKNTGIPPAAELGKNEMKSWLQPTTIPSTNNEKHLSGKQVTGSRLVKDHICFKTDSSLVKRDSCSVTEYGLRSHTSPPNSNSEENTSTGNSSKTANSFNDKSSYRIESERNMYNYNHKKTVLRKANSLPVVKTQDSVVQYRTVNTPHDINFSNIGVDNSQTVRLGTKEHVTKTNDIERNSPTDTISSIEFHDTSTSVLALTTQSKFISGKHTDHKTFIMKCPETKDKPSLRETTSSPTLYSAIKYHTQNRINSPFHETLSSDQQRTSGEHKTDSNEERGESPHKSSHLENDIITEDEQRLVVRRVLSQKFEHIEKDDENIFEKRIDYSQHRLSVVNRIKIGDHQRLDQGDLTQNISPVGSSNRMGDKQNSEDHNRYLRRSSSVETIVETGDTDLVENSPTYIKKNSLGNQKQIIEEQRPPKQDSPYQHSSPLNHSPQTDSQHLCNNQDIPFHRSTVLVPSRDLRHSGGETATQEVDRIRETKLGIELQFSSEDTALRSRVLVLLWVLLGEKRLREVGFPKEPVHRILWRAVDVCCSVAGVKSAAAVPLNSDHDCGVDMLCFRDHTHRFLEVCAPTREHWKQFGWAGLTVDAVVRKIYDEGKFLSSSIKSMSGKSFLLSVSANYPNNQDEPQLRKPFSAYSQSLIYVRNTAFPEVCMYSKTCLKRNAIFPVFFFFRFHRFPFYKELCFNKTKYKKYDRLGLQ